MRIEERLKIMRRQNKVFAQQKHARSRAIQRFDVELSNDDLRVLVSLIQAGKAIFIERQSNRITVFSILFKGKVLYPVYDSSRKSIATFLTQKMILDEK